MAVARWGGNIIALIKPQFEAGKAEVDKGAGVIKDPEIHARVIRELQAFVSETDGLTGAAIPIRQSLARKETKNFSLGLKRIKPSGPWD